jgi:hypothetical protein
VADPMGVVRMDLFDVTTQLVLLLIAAGVGVLAASAMLVRQSHEAAAASVESPFAASTEGEKICPRCAMGNLWTDATCVSCGGRLPG